MTHTYPQFTQLIFAGAFLLIVFCVVSFGQSTGARRVSFNDNWRFQRNDPLGTEGVLTWAKVKDWVAATGNEYVMDGPKPMSPAGNLGESLAYQTASIVCSRC